MSPDRRKPPPHPDRTSDETSDGRSPSDELALREAALVDVEERLRRAAFLDPLTGLGNRALLERRLQELLRTASGHPGRSYAVLFIDVDNFKYVNLGLGHATGDQLLVEVARRISVATGAPELPDPDWNHGEAPCRFAARFGGDEFVVVLDDLKTADDATSIARRIHEEMSRPLEIDDREISVQCSIGIATGGGHECRHVDLLRDADTAMAHAKATGKGRHAAFYEPMRQVARRRLQLETDLRAAVRDDRISVAFQPIVHLESGRVASFEALARWEHPELGAVSPVEFIPIAEETGLIVPLSNALLQRAVALLERLDATPGGERVRMNVNISRRQLADSEFIPTLRAIIDRMSVAPSRLCLEITESTVTTAPRRIGESLQALKDLGVQLHLDDFGTGLSSLSLLRTLPLDGIKVDRSFIDAAAGSREAIAILHAIVTLGRNLRKVTTAEGLETTTHMATVLALECDLAQGWLLGRPVAGADAHTLLGTDRSMKVSATDLRA